MSGQKVVILIINAGRWFEVFRIFLVFFDTLDGLDS